MTKIKNLISIIILNVILFSSVTANAQSLSLLKSNISFGNSSEPLKVDEAFTSEIENFGENLNIIFDIKPDHYLYKKAIELKYNGVKQPDLFLNSLKDKEGRMTHDEFFGDSEVYDLGFSFLNKSKFFEKTTVELTYQGCSHEFNLCYPPVVKTFEFEGDEIYKPTAAEQESIDAALDELKENSKTEITQDSILELASTNDANAILKLINDYKSTPYIYLIFIILGVFIAFTPCIYPLIPIVIASTSNAKSKSLSTMSYIGGMILSYVLIGLVTGYLNFNLQIFAQKSTFIYSISALLFVLAMYMLGFINIILPSKLNNAINEKMNKLNPDKYSNQFFIGFLSSLVLSPCSIAPLLGVLIFINQLGEPIFGSVLLGSMGLGIGIPIFLLSTSFNKFMPRNGAWMNEMKNIIGIVILLVMTYLLKGQIGDFNSYLLYGLIVVSYGISLLSLKNKEKVGILIVIISTLFLNNKITLESNLNNTSNNSYNEHSEALIYESVQNLSELETFIKNADRPIFIDYYAEWCISCVRMDNTVLKNEKIIKYLNKNYFMIKIDLTDITPEKKEIMDSKDILAIPYYSIIDLNKKDYVYTGEINQAKFKEILTTHSR